MGLNVYDYGARNYDPAIGRFINIDPLAEKYYQFSPYTYVGNMPTIAIDPDGNEIIFVVRGDKDRGTKTQTFTYRNGNFYHSNGKRYNPGKEGISKTMYKTLSAYRKIEASGDKELKGMLKTLETSKQKHFIEAGAESKVKPDPNTMSVSETNQKLKDGTPVDTQTTFSFSESSKKEYEQQNGIPDSEFGTVVHEMQHQFDLDQGKMSDSADVDPSAKDPAEIRAVNTENKARKMEGLPKRTKYGGEEIDPKKLN